MHHYFIFRDSSSMVFELNSLLKFLSPNRNPVYPTHSFFGRKLRLNPGCPRLNYLLG